MTHESVKLDHFCKRSLVGLECWGSESRCDRATPGEIAGLKPPKIATLAPLSEELPAQVRKRLERQWVQMKGTGPVGKVREIRSTTAIIEAKVYWGTSDRNVVETWEVAEDLVVLGQRPMQPDEVNTRQIQRQANAFGLAVKLVDSEPVAAQVAPAP